MIVLAQHLVPHGEKTMRRTIVKAMSSAWPEPRKKLPARGSKPDPLKPAIDEMLRADLDAPR